MDEIDRAIIRHLQQDGRLSNLALAERVNLTPAPCLRRVRRLEDQGVIRGYQAVVEPVALDQGFTVILEIDLAVYDRESVDNFETTMTGFAEVTELHRLFGTPDYYAHIATADLTAYESFLTEQVLTIPGIARVSSRFPMKKLKSPASAFGPDVA
ncbi:Lrp/AsnC family transcriptional regulator [Corynebacterium halotolerans]|uniref:Lrp/AsnC family transcriptional regulator n=1 Tax=Corynebacterium halotolerans TaxID=225326 RepID=UPI003CF2788D